MLGPFDDDAAHLALGTIWPRSCSSQEWAFADQLIAIETGAMFTMTKVQVLDPRRKGPMLTLDEANAIVQAAIACARRLDIRVAVAVCDQTGHLIAFNRMDRVYSTADHFAVGKAVLSARTGAPSNASAGLANHSPVGVVVAGGMPLIRIRGGLPIIRGGRIEDACGVDGSLVTNQDEACARVGIAALLPVASLIPN